MRFVFIILAIVLSLTLQRANGQLVVTDRFVSTITKTPAAWDRVALKQLSETAPILPSRQWIVLVKDNCPPCEQAKNDFTPKLRASGWSIGSDARDQIRIVNTDHEQNPLPQFANAGRPTFVLMVEGTPKIAESGYRGHREMAERFNEAGRTAQQQPRGAIRVATLPLKEEVGQLIDFVQPFLASRGPTTVDIKSDAAGSTQDFAGVSLLIPQQTAVTVANTADGISVTLSVPIVADLSRYFPMSLRVQGLAITRDSITASVPGLPDPRINLK